MNERKKKKKKKKRGRKVVLVSSKKNYYLLLFFCWGRAGGGFGVRHGVQNYIEHLKQAFKVFEPRTKLIFHSSVAKIY